MVSRYDWNRIQQAYDRGLSSIDLKKEFGVSSGSLKHAAKQGRFHFRSRADALKLSRLNPEKYTSSIPKPIGRKRDWETLQRDYDAGLSVKELSIKHGIPTSTLYNGVRRGDFKTRTSIEGAEIWRQNNPPRKHTEETKAKISAHRRAFLEANPHMAPYKLNHYSKGPSYPERYFDEVLTSAGLTFEKEYQVGLYSLDFAFPDRMIDLEIHGSQHYMDARIVESDKRRRAYLEDLSWTVIEVNWSEYQKLKKNKKEEFVADLIGKLR